KLAEENLSYHQNLMDRIKQKVDAGASRASELEQAKSRYTLALTNLATEKANAFSAMADYQRATNTMWPMEVYGDYVVQTNFELTNPERLVFALNNHQMLQSSNAKIRASKYAITSAEEGFYPRIDLRAKSDKYSNYLSTFDSRQISSIDLLASMNLYRGGADKAAREAAIRRKNQTVDEKLITCKAIRRNTQVSLYDVLNLEKRKGYFEAQLQSITSARAAYEQQFGIGRRELIDLLNAENEYYQSKRALIGVETDLSIAKLDLLAASGQLVDLFGVENMIAADEPTRRNILLYKEQTEQMQDEAPCPQELLTLKDFELPGLGFETASNDQAAPVLLTNNTANAEPIQVAQAGGAAVVPVKVLAQANNAGSVKKAMMEDPAQVSNKLISLTEKWADAWEKKT
ncbi:MAG: TolC family protein, partial [Limnobacter sp.]|nr:TolC family protein [Limnobacter sp.]